MNAGFLADGSGMFGIEILILATEYKESLVKRKSLQVS